jgi:hypothetical protein
MNKIRRKAKEERGNNLLSGRSFHFPSFPRVALIVIHKCRDAGEGPEQGRVRTAYPTMGCPSRSLEIFAYNDERAGWESRMNRATVRLSTFA